jgi:coenzyme PQQ precursor peptide PqqA
LRGRRISALNASTLAHSASTRQIQRRHSFGGNIMAWKTPKIVEIALGAEINSYACAEAAK